jgi:hypothetical protein
VDDHKMNLLAEDVHLITAPVRIAGDWIKILPFIAVLPFVSIVSLVDWLLTGTPIMSADEIMLTKILLTILSPFITTVIWLVRKHWNGVVPFGPRNTAAGSSPSTHSQVSLELSDWQANS